MGEVQVIGDTGDMDTKWRLGNSEGRDSRCQFDKVFVPDPADLVRCVILVFGQPELAILANDIEDLRTISQ